MERGPILARLETNRPKELGGSPVVRIDTQDGYRYKLEDGSWCLVRASGTEPLLRIYCETSSPERVRELLQETRRLAGV